MSILVCIIQQTFGHKMGEIRTAVFKGGERRFAGVRAMQNEKPLILCSRKMNNLKINVNQNGILDEELYS